jgi:hypothetical protein
VISKLPMGLDDLRRSLRAPLSEVLRSSAFLRRFLLRKHGGLLKSFLGLLVSFRRVFHGLFGVLVSALVIFLAVMRCGNTMSMCRKFMELGGSLVRVFWHAYPPNCKPNNSSFQNIFLRQVSRLFEAGAQYSSQQIALLARLRRYRQARIASVPTTLSKVYAFPLHCSPSKFWDLPVLF